MWSVRSRGRFRSTKPNSPGTSINTIPLCVSGCAHSPLSKRGFPIPATVSTTHLQPFNPRPCSSFLSLSQVSFNFPSLSFASACGGTERLYRGNHTQTSDKHTPSCNCKVCADRKCSLSHTHTLFLHNVWTTHLSTDN